MTVTNANPDSVLPVIGLEIHVELATATKMFCRCRNRFGDPPNTNVCPVCIGMPGVLPVMNRTAVEYAMKVGLALGCKVAGFTKWDRKSYYYPDLPKNYQISQYDLPLSAGGFLEVPLADGSLRRIRIIRAHLEEDAGKNVHDNPAHTGVDLNRAGVPLLEIVTEPDMHSAEEVLACARAMRGLVRWLGVSEANMQMGHIRFEPNINLHITPGTGNREPGTRNGEEPGATAGSGATAAAFAAVFKTPIVEVKNLNSFRALERTVEYEIERQYAEWRADPAGFTMERLGKQNRGFDDGRQITVFQREKEEAHDYRYFPDPDLVPVLVDEAWRSRVAAQIGELPLARRARYMEKHALAFKEADALTQDSPTGDLLDSAVAAGASPKRVTNLLLGRIAAAANERSCSLAEVGVSAGQLAELAKMIDAGQVNASAGDRILDAIIATNRDRKGADVVAGSDRKGADVVAGSDREGADVVPDGRGSLECGGLDTALDRTGENQSGVTAAALQGPPNERARTLSPMDIAKRLNLLAVTDSSAIEQWVDAAIAANPGPAEQVRSGDKKAKQAFGFLMGAVMRVSGGKAPPAAVKELLERKLKP